MADPNAAGGYCRTQCRGQPAPDDCCRVKLGIPGCPDADCVNGAYSGAFGTSAPVTVFASTTAPPAATLPPATPTWPAAQAAEARAQALAQQYAAQYVAQYQAQMQAQIQQFQAQAQATCQAQVRAARAQCRRPRAQTPAEACAAWPSCATHPQPHECCARKPGQCYDQWCAVTRYGPSTAAPATPQSTTMPPYLDYRYYYAQALAP